MEVACMHKAKLLKNSIDFFTNIKKTVILILTRNIRDKFHL